MEIQKEAASLVASEEIMGVEEQARKGCVPVLVGEEGTAMERVMLPIELLANPDIIELLKISADEVGYPQGLLKIPICRANSFKRLIEKIRSQEKRAKSQRVGVFNKKVKPISG